MSPPQLNKEEALEIIGAIDISVNVTDYTSLSAGLILVLIFSNK